MAMFNDEDLMHPIEPLLRDNYTSTDIRGIVAHLEAAGTFLFPVLPTGLYSAALATSSEYEYTGYANVWVRDTIQITNMLFELGDFAAAARTVRALTTFLHTQREKVDRIVAGLADPKLTKNRPHIRFDGVHLAELPVTWPHAQNDALGYWLWMSGRLIRDGHWAPTAEDRELFAAFVRYFDAIEFWHDADNGHWEETAKIEASSIGAVVAGLQSLRDSGAVARWQSGVRMMNGLIERGRLALDAILPAECVQPDLARQYDAALLFLIYPLDVVSPEMADRIVDDVSTHLAGPYGIRRYLGDSYWCQDFKAQVEKERRTSDVSDDTSARDQLLQPGCEAQWCIFDPIVSIIHLRRFRETGDPRRKLAAIRHLNRSLRQVTGNGTPFPPLRCPESYYLENGRYVPNDITPLLWTQANLRLALHEMANTCASSAS